MKELNVNQMEQINGGMKESCMDAIGYGLGAIIFSGTVGISVGFLIAGIISLRSCIG